VSNVTERLYDNGHIRTFSARVLDCRRAGESYEVILDRSAFFPGGGGQEPDTGTIGGAAVTGALERGGAIVHLTDHALEPGAQVDCAVDWQTRFARMQSHSGEHLFSGAVHRLYGFENVGFHMDGDEMTVDFDGRMSPGETARAEELANRLVWEDQPVRVWYPSPEELGTLRYRSKLELTEQVRIVEMEGADICACCAPHVLRTGEIGLIKVLGQMYHRGGTRLRLRCGAAALADCRVKYENAARVSALLSARQEEIADAVERLMREKQGMKDEIYHLKKARNGAVIASLERTEGNICLFFPEMDQDSLREIANAGAARCTGLCAAFSGGDGAWRYIMASAGVDLRAAAGAINAAISGKGGGSAGMIQGSASADRETIEAFFLR